MEGTLKLTESQPPLGTLSTQIPKREMNHKGRATLEFAVEETHDGSAWQAQILKLILETMRAIKA